MNSPKATILLDGPKLERTGARTFRVPSPYPGLKVRIIVGRFRLKALSSSRAAVPARHLAEGFSDALSLTRKRARLWADGALQRSRFAHQYCLDAKDSVRVILALRTWLSGCGWMESGW